MHPEHCAGLLPEHIQAVKDRIVINLLHNHEGALAIIKHAYCELYGTGTNSPATVSDEVEEKVMYLYMVLLGFPRTSEKRSAVLRGGE